MSDLTACIGRIMLAVSSIGLGAIVVAGCGDNEVDLYPALSNELQELKSERQDAGSSLYGTWTPSDGTSAKSFNEDGSCRGFFYVSRTGKPLDIGGAMSCQLRSGRGVGNSCAEQGG